LPPGYKIELEPEIKPTIEFNHAVQYVAKIKQRFKPAIYSEFLEILHDYQSKRTIDDVDICIFVLCISTS
jgi:paired amphipathic helix protein Sin3a